MKLLTIYMRPSPKHININLSLARGCQNIKFPCKVTNCNAIEGISLFTFLRKKLCAGMTVEAAILLPLFLFFFINLGSAIEMMRLHGNLQLALWNVGRQLAIYGYALESIEDIKESYEEIERKPENESWWEELIDIALSYTYVKGEVISYVGVEYLEESPLTYGADGLQFWESDIVSHDCVELIVTYSVSPLSKLIGFRPFRMVNRYYSHVWSGYHILGTADEEGDKIVYVAEQGMVYHQNRNCTHLMLSIQQVTLEEAFLRRNFQGGKYSECEKCGQNNFPSRVYITNEGNRYHYDRGCPGLKRTIFTILKKEAEKYKPCKRCFGG